MWWTGQNLDSPREDRQGIIWHTLVWHRYQGKDDELRIYFWNDEKTITGKAEYIGQSLDAHRIKSRIAKLISDPNYREIYLCKLKFPIKRHY